MKWGYLSVVTLAFIFSTTFHFLANRSYTFNSHSRSIARQLFRYVVLIVINYLITILVVRYSVEILHFHPYLGVLMSTFLTVMVGYILSHFWVFNERGVD
jgi:putative flippase GtrA